MSSGGHQAQGAMIESRQEAAHDRFGLGGSEIIV
jgi:hypothetical protein